MKTKSLTSYFLILSIWCSLFDPFVSAQNPKPTPTPEPKGLQFSITEGSKTPEKRIEVKPTKAENLDESSTNDIFRRLPEMRAETIEKASFNIRPDSIKPPKTGNIIEQKFPADETLSAPDVSNSAPQSLEIERFSPSGNVPIVADFSVTFSQPMIAVSTQESASETFPVTLSPAVKGKWRWLGTTTLIFDAETRFLMATVFTATIPKGTTSAIGGILEKEVSWTFTTPTPRVELFLPKSGSLSVRRDAIMFAKFDQEIDRNAVLQKVNKTSNAEKTLFRLANETEISGNKEIEEIIKETQPNRWIAFRSVNNFPSGSKIEISFDKGLPSSEGNLVTEKPQTFSFQTFAALKISKNYCGWEKATPNCESSDQLKIDFNNSLNEESLDKKQIKIRPKIDEPEITVDGNTIEISGYKKTRTRYTVTLPKTLKDEFGQMLGKDQSVEFDIQANEPSLSSERDDFITLDPNAKPSFSVWSENYLSLNIKLFSVKPEEFKAFSEYLASEDKSKPPTIGTLFSNRQIKIKSKPDETTETEIDLNPVLMNGFGHVLLVVTTPNPEEEPIVKWLQKTNIGIDAVSDYEQISVFTSDIRDGKPLKNVEISFPNGDVSKTNDYGISELKLPTKAAFTENWIVGRLFNDSIIFRNNDDRAYNSWILDPQNDSLRWFVFDDRKMYRPGETVSIKGYIRKIIGGKFADVAELGDSLKSVFYSLKDSKGNEIAKRSPEINTFGAFDFKLELPKSVNLGYQKLVFATDSKLQNDWFSHEIQVQEFRRPEFEVSAKVESAAPFFVGESAKISTEAKYYSGGFLVDADTKWNVTATTTSYTPPNRDDFTFGKFVPWWRESSDREYERTTRKITGKTDKNGNHFIDLSFDSVNPARPYSIKAEAEVQDVNRQAFSASTTLLVHPSSLYVGIRTPKTFVNPNESLKIETITTDIDGKAIANTPISIVAELKDWEKVKGEWEEITVDTQRCNLISKEDISSCEIIAKGGGLYTITATVDDNRDRKNESELTVWVSGANKKPEREVEEEDAELIPDKKEYSPNETAEILVNSPFFPAEGVMTLDRNGIVKTERFTMNSASTVLKIPIEEAYLPNIRVRVDLVGATPRIYFDDEDDEKLPKRPAFATGELNLNISTASRKLTVSAEAIDKTLEPGGETKINIDVKDYQGIASANTEVAVVAVDESLLALTDYRIENPLESFYPEIESGVTGYHSREDILLADPEIEGRGVGRAYGYGNGSSDRMSGGGGGGGGLRMPDSPFRRLEIISSLQRPPSVKFGEPDQIRMRENFDALAIFSPSVVTDANGKATVNLKLPDNLTRYRITAVAVTKSKQFGLGESNITAKQALQVRSSPPRFMNFGDRVELPVVLQNQTDSPLSVNVAMRASNAILTNGNGRKVIIAANDRVEVRFHVMTNNAGIARFQIGAVSGKLADAAEFEFPVYTPATTEAFATYGTTEANGAIVQTIFAPENVYSEFGGLEISTSSTQLQELTDAFIYLQNYPFECSEQISSRVLSVAALRDILTAFEAKDMPSKGEIEAKMIADLERLQKLQHADGGFSFWRSDDESIPYLSVHVAHAIARAKAKGYSVSYATLDKSNEYLRNIEAKYPKDYSEESRWAISSYALYVRNLLGQKDEIKAKTLIRTATLEKLSAESIGWLLSVLANDKNSVLEVEEMKRNLFNRITETASSAHFVTKYKDGEYVLLSSDRRADGVILEALLVLEGRTATAKERLSDSQTTIGSKETLTRVRGSADLIPKLVRGLLANRVKGRWRSTQENAFVLLALDKYFQVYEKTKPNFVAKMWLGDAYAGEQKYAAYTTDSNLVNIPMSYLQSQNPQQNLVLDKQGAGRLYYRIGMKYASKNLKSNAADYGFQVSRTYEAIDDPTDVKQNSDGSWTIKSGSRVRVRLQMIAPTRRYHVALVDNLPAGIEIINPDLAVSKSNDVKDSKEFQRSSRWFNHQNLRDNRTEAFTSLLWEGNWSYSYIARATTPGMFIVPSAKAEEMYSPETFGQSRSDVVNIK